MKANDVSVGLAHEIIVRACAAGLEMPHLTKLSQDEALLRQVKLVMDGQAEIKILDHTIDCSAPTFTPDGWSVLPDNEQLPNRVTGQFKWDANKIALHLDDGQKSGKCITGNKLREALKTQKVLPANVLDYLLKQENQYIIPEEWKGKVVFFWGTIYRGRDGNLYVRYLLCLGGEWFWHCLWLEDDWYAYNPAAFAQD